MRGRKDFAHPSGVLRGQPRDEQRGLLAGEIDRRTAVRLGHPEQVLEGGLLAEDGLVVRLVAVGGQPATEEQQAALGHTFERIHSKTRKKNASEWIQE